MNCCLYGNCACGCKHDRVKETFKKIEEKNENGDVWMTGKEFAGYQHYCDKNPDGYTEWHEKHGNEKVNDLLNVNDDNVMTCYEPSDLTKTVNEMNSKIKELVDVVNSCNKTIGNFTNYCTKEQAIKAVSLGANLDKCANTNSSLCVEIDDKFYLIPTTQQMIGWLREKSIYMSLKHNRFCSDAIIRVFNTTTKQYEDVDIVYITEEFSGNMSRECEINAIDIALGYLERHTYDD